MNNIRSIPRPGVSYGFTTPFEVIWDISLLSVNYISLIERESLALNNVNLHMNCYFGYMDSKEKYINPCLPTVGLCSGRQACLPFRLAFAPAGRLLLILVLKSSLLIDFLNHVLGNRETYRTLPTSTVKILAIPQ